jgi:hypothetical protein
MTIFVRFNGLSEAQGTLRALPAHLERQTILRMAQRAFDVAEAGAARHNKTGALLQSLFNRPVPKGREIGHDLQRAPHAVFVQFGTRPHTIRPRRRKALRWAAGGRFIFAGRVDHPGYRGDAYLTLAATQALREFAAIVDQALKEAP